MCHSSYYCDSEKTTKSSQKSDCRIQEICNLALKIIDSSLENNQQETNSSSDSPKELTTSSSSDHGVLVSDSRDEENAPALSGSLNSFSKTTRPGTGLDHNEPDSFPYEAEIGVDFVLGLNPILNHLELLSVTLIELELELLKDRSKKNQSYAESAFTIDNRKTRASSVGDLGNLEQTEDYDQPSINNDLDKLEDSLKNLRLIKLIVVFIDYKNHQLILNLLSVLVNQANQSLNRLNSLMDQYYQHDPLHHHHHHHHPLRRTGTTAINLDPIILTGFPFVLHSTISNRFKCQNLTSLAILDTAPGVGELMHLILD